ncbi:MAG: hypothetical protein M3305_11440 [Actinomycetota bacterium]|nr:hypothetical protein [Actinomycetota bacterium]
MSNSQVGQTYERFLELPVAVVLAVLWLMGAVLEGTCVLALFVSAQWSVFVLW